jgi:hypothetical protein
VGAGRPGVRVRLPHRLDARERLADLCRLEGDRVEAGRWSYLNEQRDPDLLAGLVLLALVVGAVTVFSWIF